jgi:hypothetical protein
MFNNKGLVPKNVYNMLLHEDGQQNATCPSFVIYNYLRVHAYQFLQIYTHITYI